MGYDPSKATVVMCHVRKPAGTAASALGKERYINGEQNAPLMLCTWRYINELYLHLQYSLVLDLALIMSASVIHT